MAAFSYGLVPRAWHMGVCAQTQGLMIMILTSQNPHSVKDTRPVELIEKGPILVDAVR
jgi:hypothetical protein